MSGSASSAGRLPRMAPPIESRIPHVGRHVLVYDNCAVHMSSARPRGPPHARSARSRPLAKEYDDLPDLDILEDEEDEDARAFSRLQRESNAWLLFSGVLALVVTLFITTFTRTPQQLAAQQASRELTAMLTARLNALLTESTGTPHNLTLPRALAPERPCLATEMRDAWVPALCYASLLCAVLSALVALQIKHWLMSCSLAFFPLAPPTIDLPALRTAAARFQEYKSARKSTVVKTRRVDWLLPPIMYSAVALFACGLVVKLGTFAWLSVMA